MLKELNQNEQFFIENINEDLCNNIAILQFQTDSYIKLFTSYMNNTSEMANEFNLKKFLDKYSNLCADESNTQIKLLQDVLKDEYQYLLENKFRFSLDHINKTLRITKM